MTIKGAWNWARGKGEGGIADENPFGVLQRQMNRVFDDFFSGIDIQPFSGWADKFGGFNPRVTVREDDRQITIEAELPGMEQKDIDIALTKDAVTLRGEKRIEREEQTNAREHYSERSYGTFERVIPLRVEIDEDKVDARFDKGVLTVVLPKTAAAQSQSKKIPIRSA